MTRWTRRLLIGAIAIMVPVLAGCEAGQDAPTLDFHPASFGLSTTVNGIGVSNAFVLGPGLDTELVRGDQAGVFMALSTQNSGDKLLSASAPGTARSVTLVNGPVELAPGALVNMSGPTPEIVLNGLIRGLDGGETVFLVLNFASAGIVTLNVPVEPAAYEYATFSPPAPSRRRPRRPRARPRRAAARVRVPVPALGPVRRLRLRCPVPPRPPRRPPPRPRRYGPGAGATAVRRPGRQATDSNL